MHGHQPAVVPRLGRLAIDEKVNESSQSWPVSPLPYNLERTGKYSFWRKTHKGLQTTFSDCGNQYNFANYPIMILTELLLTLYCQPNKIARGPLYQASVTPWQSGQLACYLISDIIRRVSRKTIETVQLRVSNMYPELYGFFIFLFSWRFVCLYTGF